MPDAKTEKLGFAGLGPCSGGQAEYLRVPFGGLNCLKLPEDAREQESDYVMLSDIFPTGWYATELAGLEPGEPIVIYDRGPVGLTAARSAMIKDVSQVFIIVHYSDRLRLAERKPVPRRQLARAH